MSLSTTLFLALATALPAAEKPTFDAEALAKSIAPFVEDRTFLVVHLDLTRIDVGTLMDRLAVFIGDDAERKAAAKGMFTELAALTKAGARDAFMVVSLADIPERGPFFILPAKREAAKAVAREALRFPGKPGSYGVTEMEGTVVVAEAETVTRLRELFPKPQPRPELAKAFALAGPGCVQAVAVPPTDMPRIVEELVRTVPAEWGGGPIAVLTRGLKAITLAIDCTPKMQLRLTVQAADADAAKALHSLLKRATEHLIKSDIGRNSPGIEKLLAAVTPTVKGDRLVLEMDEVKFVQTFEKPAEKVREAAAQQLSMNNLKQIGLAMHSSLDVKGRFPTPAIVDKAGKPLLSWRVHLLPYLEQNALYKEFHLDEPWDSDHNKKLIEKMPPVFRSTADGKLAKEGKTTYLVPRGKAMMFPGGEGVRIVDITDGTSNTILVVDAADDRAVIWTKPDDLQVDPKEPQKGLAARRNDGYLMLFVDGSVRAIKKSIDKNTLWALFTIAGGEPVEIP